MADQDVTRESIAEMLAIYVCVSRKDLREAARADTWEKWDGLTLNVELEKAPVHYPDTSYREGIHAELQDSNTVAVLDAFHDRIDRSWRPPCPTRAAINAAFDAMCVHYGV